MEHHQYLPEGWGGLSCQTRHNPRTLEQARESGAILSGRAVLCDQGLNLQVDLGQCKGIIPRAETALGIQEGTTREIAVLSRVGKPVSFQVLGQEHGQWLLSRRNAQIATARHYLAHLRPGDVIPARSTHLEPFGVFVDIGCGIVSMIGIETLTVSRIPHPAERVRVGQDLFAIVRAVMPNRISLSHKELLGTWEENAEAFAPGMTVQGIVRRVESYGAFIELAPNLSGLAEYRSDLAIGDSVTVYIKAILPERMKIKLVVLDRREERACRMLQRSDYFITQGHLDRWQYHPSCCLEKQVVTEFCNLTKPSFEAIKKAPFGAGITTV